MAMNTAELVAILMRSNETIEKTEMMLPMSEAKRKRQKGVTTVEYAVMLVLIAIAIMVANPNISSSVVGVFSDISSRLAGRSEFKGSGHMKSSEKTDTSETP